MIKQMMCATVLCALCCGTGLSASVIPVTDAKVLKGLSPYNWVCKDDSISSSVNGASITLGFKGTQQVVLQMDTDQITTPLPSRYPIIAWSVNGGDLQTHQLVPKEKSVLLASGVNDPVINLYINGGISTEDNEGNKVERTLRSLRLLLFQGFHSALHRLTASGGDRNDRDSLSTGSR